VTRSFSAEVPFVEVIRQLSYRPDRLALPSPLFHEFAHQPRSVFTVTQGTEGLQIPRMVAPLLGSRDDMMDLEALPDIPTSSPSSGCVIHLPPPPSEVHAAILTNVAVPSLHRALHSDPDQATDQIRGAIGVRQLGGSLGKYLWPSGCSPRICFRTCFTLLHSSQRRFAVEFSKWRFLQKGHWTRCPDLA
jgi:hypothetical protein